MGYGTEPWEDSEAILSPGVRFHTPAEPHVKIREWTRSLWGRTWDRPDFRYPYEPDDGREDLEAGDDILRVLRGGSWLNHQDYARCSYRSRYYRDLSDDDGGFRCVSPV
jgi:formylglycine-generating enzyme required for sulfatase activity